MMDYHWDLGCHHNVMGVTGIYVVCGVHNEEKMVIEQPW